MAEAIVRGVIAAELFQPKQIIAADPSPQRRELFERDLGVKIAPSNIAAVRGSKTVLLSV